MTDFVSVHPALESALKNRGYDTLTPVQQDMLRADLQGVDMLVSAQTGSGKTVAFGIALAPTLLGEAHNFGRADVPLALAIAPTRELAMQVKRELEWLYKDTGARIASCVGGMDMREERRALNQGAHIVVGTPGRLKDHIMRNSLDMSGLQAIVLDEADEMLDLGFREDLEYMLAEAPEGRRTLMFSATVPRSILGLAKKYQRDAVRVNTVSEAKQHTDIEYRALSVTNKDQENAIINVLRYYEAKNAIVFCGTRATVNHLTTRLNNRGFSVVALSGELNQAARTHALQAMRDGRARVCVATDVAARGIDLPDLELVIHADIPKNSEILLHRSGRTGRAGRKGVSALIVPNSGRRKAERMLQGAKIEAEWAAPPTVEQVLERDDARILADESLTEAPTEAEATFAAKLVDTFGVDQVAAALVRQLRKGQTAPEELSNIGTEEARQPRRDDFKNGVWVSLSVGRNQKAEPRWILPVLCKVGKMSKPDIGGIKVQNDETYVEIAPNAIDDFMTALGPRALMDGSIKVTRLEGVPVGAKGGKKPYEKKPYGKSDDKKPYEKKPYDKKPYGKSDDKKPYAKKSDDGKPAHWRETDGAVKPKKPHKKKLARAAALAAKQGQGKPKKPKG